MAVVFKTDHLEASVNNSGDLEINVSNYDDDTKYETTCLDKEEVGELIRFLQKSHSKMTINE